MCLTLFSPRYHPVSAVLQCTCCSIELHIDPKRPGAGKRSEWSAAPAFVFGNVDSVHYSCGPQTRCPATTSQSGSSVASALAAAAAAAVLQRRAGCARTQSTVRSMGAGGRKKEAKCALRNCSFFYSLTQYMSLNHQRSSPWHTRGPLLFCLKT